MPENMQNAVDKLADIFENGIHNLDKHNKPLDL